MLIIGNVLEPINITIFSYVAKKGSPTTSTHTVNYIGAEKSKIIAVALKTRWSKRNIFHMNYLVDHVVYS